MLGLQRLSLVAASGGYFSLWSQTSRCGGFSCFRAQALGVWASGVAACGLSGNVTWAQPFLCLWDPPEPGVDPMSPALAGGLLPTAPPGKSLVFFFKKLIYLFGYARSLDLVCELLVSAFGSCLPEQ